MQLAVPDNRLQGIGAILGAMLVLSAQDAFIKSISAGFPLHQIILVRASTALLLVALFVHWEGGFGILRTNRPGLQALRCLLI